MIIEAKAGNSRDGFVTIDNIIFDAKDIFTCPIKPDYANPFTTPAPTSTTALFPACNFDEGSLCDWSLDPSTLPWQL